MSIDKHNHHHHTDPQVNSSRLLFTILLNFIIPGIQIIGGVISNSMALISDAVHNFSDLGGLLVSYIALRISKKGASATLSFGYQRAEIVGALLNVAMLMCAVVFIIIEAFGRIYQPEPVSGSIVMLMGGVGIIGNGFSAVLLYRDSKHNLNIKGAFIHMLGDFFTSLAVFVNGAVLIFKPWYWLDTIFSFFIAVFILKNCWYIMKTAVSILMNATPAGLDLMEVQKFLESRPEIESAHYLHAWNFGSSGIAFSCHMTVMDQPVSKTDILSEKLRYHLFHKFGIDHPVFQFETDKCGNGNLLCEVSGSERSI